MIYTHKVYLEFEIKNIIMGKDEFFSFFLKDQNFSSFGVQ